MSALFDEAVGIGRRRLAEESRFQRRLRRRGRRGDCVGGAAGLTLFDSVPVSARLGPHAPSAKTKATTAKLGTQFIRIAPSRALRPRTACIGHSRRRIEMGSRENHVRQAR